MGVNLIIVGGRRLNLTFRTANHIRHSPVLRPSLTVPNSTNGQRLVKPDVLKMVNVPK